MKKSLVYQNRKRATAVCSGDVHWWLSRDQYSAHMLVSGLSAELFWQGQTT
jgi:hypothetical protein